MDLEKTSLFYSQKLIFFSCFSFILLIRILYIFTFPLNFGGDASIYYTMILYKKSSLLMAAGYPFLMMYPFQFFHFIRGLIAHKWALPLDLAPNEWWSTSKDWLLGSRVLENNFSWVDVFDNREFVLFQHGLEILALFLGFRLIKKYFGFSVGIVFLLLYGLSPLSLEYPSSVVPEWLQGALLIFWIYIAEKALNSPFAKKLFLYGLLGVLSTLGFLVKFNIFPIFFILYICLLFLDKECLKKVAYKAFSFLIGTASVFFIFLFYYHIPTTGTSVLTMNSWVLADKCFQFHPHRSLIPEDGLFTKRLLAIEKTLPLENKGEAVGAASYFYHINAVDNQERVPYREKSLYLLHANHKDLDKELSLYRYNYISSQTPLLRLAYYIGLYEYKTLLKDVYIELIQKYPWEFLQDTLHNSLLSLINNKNSYEFRPSWQEVQKGSQPITKSRYGFTRFLWPNDRMISYHDPVVFLPGVWFFTKLQKLWPPLWFIWGLAFLTFITAIKSSKKEGIALKSSLIIGCMTILLIFIGVSNIIMLFRMKEYRAVHMIVILLASIGLVQLKIYTQQIISLLKYRFKLRGICEPD